MIYRSKAPLRISFGGGGTDVPPYPEEKGGCVLNTTINKFAYTTLVTTDQQDIKVKSLDFDIVAKYNFDSDLRYDGELDLVKSVIKNMTYKEGARVLLHSDAPPGSGLGSSSTMCVALIGLFREAMNKAMTDYDVAELAYYIERKDLGISGGLQDQYAATFGGFNFTEFRKNSVVVNPLEINPDTRAELEMGLLLCYTGGTRLSAHIIDDQVAGFKKKKVDVVKALDGTKDIALGMKKAILSGDIEQFGELLHQGWMHKKKFSTKITNPEIDKLYEIALENGAFGGKILGAGGGGYLLVLTDPECRYTVAKALMDRGGTIVPFRFDREGLQTWKVDRQT